jgi:shikimate kinase
MNKLSPQAFLSRNAYLCQKELCIMIRIFLIGYMGAGKTTLGKAFAHNLNILFIDLDRYIEGRFHKTVRELFAERGETGFREIERNMLHEVGEIEDVVISTGGGAPCFFNNMEYMNEHGTTVFLNVSPDVLHKRLNVATQSRPILQGKTKEELYDFIVEKLAERMSYYSMAQYSFNTNGLDNRWQINDSAQRLREMLSL